MKLGIVLSALLLPLSVLASSGGNYVGVGLCPDPSVPPFNQPIHIVRECTSYEEAWMTALEIRSEIIEKLTDAYCSKAEVVQNGITSRCVAVPGMGYGVQTDHQNVAEINVSGMICQRQIPCALPSVSNYSSPEAYLRAKMEATTACQAAWSAHKR